MLIVDLLQTIVIIYVVFQFMLIKALKLAAITCTFMILISAKKLSDSKSIRFGDKS